MIWAKNGEYTNGSSVVRDIKKVIIERKCDIDVSVEYCVVSI